MKLTLSENIRSFRKQRKLTQEQLAEMLGVTTGAVYKWESGLSIPDIGLIVEMADFFDTSVDVLLGYRMKDNRLKETVARLKKYRHDKDPAGLRRPETPSYLDKVNGPFFACMAFSQYKMGETDAARASLQSAKRIAEAFDAAPNYDWEAVRFVEHPEKMSAYDDLGATAMQSVESVIKSFDDEAFSAMWNEINEQDK